MKVHVEASVPVMLSAKVRQAASLFDCPVPEKATLVADHDLPVEDRPWHVGLVTGPSGAGKSLLAEAAWPGRVVRGFAWDGRAILDGFPPALGIKDVTGLLASVGLGSPPAWIRPFATLSTGEAFRATIARAMAEADGLVVVDEFTSVVDRQVAKVASHTIAKAVRRADRQLVAVSCHCDITDWLQPDWVYDVAAAEFCWRPVQQPHPPIRLEVCQCPRALWQMFARHHYLSSHLHPGAHCFAAYMADRPVAFTSFLNFPHPRTGNIRMAHRLVVLPDWQGLGIAGRLADWLGQHLWDQALRYRFTTAHPALHGYFARSPRWREVGQRRKARLQTATSHAGLRARQLEPRTLGLRSFEYRAPKG